MKYAESLVKRAEEQAAAAQDNGALERMSPGEIGWGIAGAGGGALLGYTLARLLHRKPGTRTKLLYALLGAAGGAGGSQLLLNALPGANGGSVRDDMRNQNAAPDAPVTEAPADNGSGKPGWLNARNTAAISGLVGAVRGARLGAEKGGILNPNAYETLMYLLHRDRATLESQLNASILAGNNSMDKLLARGRYGNFVTGMDPANNTLKLKDMGRNPVRGLTNAVAGGALHAGAGYLAHKGIEKLVDRFSQNIDASNAAASAQELIARAASGK